MGWLIQENLVSTVVTVFNNPRLVVDTINSVLQQSYRPIEIIVVDNGSTDETAVVLDRLSHEHDEVRVFTQQHGGVGGAREVGRINVKGEFVQYLDCYEVLAADKFSLQVTALKGDVGAHVAYGKTARSSEQGRDLQDATESEEAPPKAMFPFFLTSRLWKTSAPLYRRNAIDIAGPWLEFDKDIDWEYDCRIARDGGRLIYIDEFVSSVNVSVVQKQRGSATALQERSLVQAKIFRHAQRYMQLEDRKTDITESDWQKFSRLVFELAKECALSGLTTEARAMLRISIEANGKKTPAHRAFLMGVKWFGWKKAAQMARAVNRQLDKP